MAVTVTAVLHRSKELATFGFSLRQLETSEHVVYKITKNTPADMCYEIEIGDLLTQINGADVQWMTTKEVLKLIREAPEKINLTLKKDDNIKRIVYSMIRENSPERELPQQQRQPPVELEVELYQKGEERGFGIVLQWADILEHFVSHVVDNSAASGKLEVGDVLVSANGRDLQQMSVTNVLKCLGRLPSPIKLKLKRDPWIKNYVRVQFPNEINNRDARDEPCMSKQSKPNTLGSPEGLHQQQQQRTLSTSQLVQPKISNQHLPSSPDTASPKQLAGFRECHSESIGRKSRIPQAITQHNSAPQSPSRGRKPPRASQIPMAKADVKASRFVITGKSQFQLSRELEEYTLANPPLADGGQRNAPLVQYDTLSSSTSRSDENSSSCLLEDSANANEATKPSTVTSPRLNLGPAYDKLGGCVFPVGNNTVPFYVILDGQAENMRTRQERANSDGGGGGGDAGEQNQNHKDNCDSAPTGHKHDAIGTRTYVCEGGGDKDDKQPQGFPGARRDDPLEQSHSVPTSPTPYTVATGGASAAAAASAGVNSLPTSPECGGPADQQQQQQQQQLFRYKPSSGTTQADSSANAGSNASSGELTANTNMSSGSLGGPPVRKCDSAGFRTSRSEDHLQHSQRDGGIGAIVAVDIDEDVYSSLNTLLDTQHDSQEAPMSDRERFLWTYNMQPAPKPHGTAHGQAAGVGAGPTQLSFSSSVSSSPQRSASESPASPTSVSSSVMSSSGGSREHSHTGGHGGTGGVGRVGGIAAPTTTSGGHTNQLQQGHHPHQLQQQQQHTTAPQSYAGQGVQSGGATGGDHSVSEAVSNLSSPDYQDEHDLFSSKDLMAMAISDHSDSDSTILVSETTHRFDLPLGGGTDASTDHKLIIEVKPDESREDGSQQESDDLAAELQQQAPQQQQQQQQQQGHSQANRDSSPPISEDGSDEESLHSFHYSPKAIDRPSVERLARRLFYLEGFSKSDICRHLSKNNEFSRVLGDEYLKHYNFTNMPLDVALRAFVKEVPLFGETQERERVMYHFAKRYDDNNPGVFKSVGAAHFLISALLILNSDIHGEVHFHRTFSTFSKRLKCGNEGENFPKELLKHLFSSIKDHRLEPAIDDDSKRSSENSGECYDGNNGGEHAGSLQGPPVGPNPFLEAPRIIAAIEFKKGYVVRKSCYETNHKRTPFGRRSWKMFYCTLRDLVLYLHNDEHGFKRNQVSDNVYNGIRIHHALATRATDYSKRNHVFRLQTADQSEFLFQTSDSKELQSWIDTINYVCATFSAPPLEGAVGSQKRFQRPLLPCSSTKLSMREQLASHETQYEKLSRMLEEHKESGPPSKGLSLQNYKEKDYYLQYEMKRYKTYCHLLNSRLTLEPQDFGNQHTVSAAALSETSMDDENGDDDGQDDETDDDLLSEPICNATSLLAHHRFQGLAAAKRPAMK